MLSHFYPNIFRQIQEAAFVPVRQLDGGGPDLDRKPTGQPEDEVQAAGRVPRRRRHPSTGKKLNEIPSNFFNYLLIIQVIIE